ncbi:MAG TPA: nuclease-related domain-containing protein [Actinomycetes bacterium]|nr:nuclease-related domain-containing protein [Actinomycetes bacterium]
MAFSMWLWVRDAVPRHIEQWQDGAEGERMTEKALRPLEREGWLVEHDLAGLYGNVDHLVVSEAGVFVLDSKRWFGEVTVEGGTPTITPRDNPDAAWSPTGLARRMRGLGFRQKDAIERLTGVRTWVQSVVVIWAPFEQQVVESDRVVYIHGDCLSGWLRARRRLLDPSTVDRIRQKVRAG